MGGDKDSKSGDESDEEADDNFELKQLLLSLQNASKPDPKSQVTEEAEGTPADEDPADALVWCINTVMKSQRETRTQMQLQGFVLGLLEVKPKLIPPKIVSDDLVYERERQRAKFFCHMPSLELNKGTTLHVRRAPEPPSEGNSEPSSPENKGSPGVRAYGTLTTLSEVKRMPAPQPDVVEKLVKDPVVARRGLHVDERARKRMKRRHRLFAKASELEEIERTAKRPSYVPLCGWKEYEEQQRRVYEETRAEFDEPWTYEEDSSEEEEEEEEREPTPPPPNPLTMPDTESDEEEIDIAPKNPGSPEQTITLPPINRNGSSHSTITQLARAGRPCPSTTSHTRTDASMPKIGTFARRYGPPSVPSRTKRPQYLYLAECEKARILPKLPKFLVQESKEGNGTKVVELSKGLMDGDLKAMAGALAQAFGQGQVIRFDASGNYFNGGTLGNVLATAIRTNERSCSQLQELDLSHNAKFESAEDICVALDHMPSLRRLNLSKLRFARSNVWREVTESLENRRFLTHLELADCQLGWFSQQSCIAVAELVEKLPELQHVDLSFNFLNSAEAMRVLGQSLERHEAIQTLLLSAASGGGRQELAYNNTGTASVSFHPMQLMFESLAFNISLKELDVSSCGLGPDCWFVLEDAIATHPALENLYVQQNPIGEVGFRSIARALARPEKFAPENKLAKADLGHTSGAAIPEELGALVFQYADPTGTYHDVDLSTPYGRAFLRSLCRRADISKVAQSTAFREIKFNNVKPKGEWCSKDARTGAWVIKETKKAFISFTLQDISVIENAPSAMIAVKQFFKTRKIPVSLRRFLPLAAAFKSMNTDHQRLMFLRSLKSDFMIKFCHLTWFASCCPELTPEIVGVLFSAVDMLDKSPLLEMVKNKDQLRACQTKTARLFYFNPLNATDRFRLALENPADRGVAERLMAINLWDRVRAMGGGILDASRRGNFEGFRNERLDRLPFEFNCTSWDLPFTGVLEWDYVSPMKLGKEKRTDPRILQKVLDVLGNSKCVWVSKVQALRSISHSFVLTPENLWDYLSFFPKGRLPVGSPGVDPDTLVLPSCRADVFVMMFCRTLHLMLPPKQAEKDMYVVGPHILYNRDLLDPGCMVEIRERLGWLNTFDAYHCCAAKGPTKRGKDVNLSDTYSLDLGFHEEFQVAKFLILLGAVEDGENMLECHWTGAGFLERTGAPFLVPASWLPDPPAHGVFSLRYSSGKNGEYVMWDKRAEIMRKLSPLPY
mmetsp:Transcript_39944/g.89654  ORF Transcript_39944/g.89654 Transcript_39944/m.89654 type:complete len:1242 (+) Transcript_39944:42-3767(+)